MKFSVDGKIFSKFPGVEIGVLVITGMNNHGASKEILKLLRQEERQQREKLTGVELGSLPEIAAWRKIYKDFGSDPRAYSSSVEALLRRARGGKKPLPQINNLVDFYNFLSLKYHFPAGAEDLDKVVGDIELTFAEGNEKGRYIGSSKEDTCYKGEVIYKDKEGFICRRWNWREADRTKIDFETQNAVLVLEKAPGLDEAGFHRALKKAQELIGKFLKGNVQLFVLTKDNSLFEIDFQTGRKKQAVKVSLKGKVKKKKGVKTVYASEKLAELMLSDTTSLSYQLKKIILNALPEVLGDSDRDSDRAKKFKDFEVQIEHPAIYDYGDYSSNVAMVLAKELEMKPIELAKKLKEKIKEYIRQNQTISALADSSGLSDYTIQPSNLLEKVEVADPGFINLWLRKDYLISQMKQVLESCDIDIASQRSIVTTGLPLLNRKIMVEYTDPNPFKEFHIGHLYSNAIGESLSKILEGIGAVVWRADFYGDVGMHAAKSVWGMREKFKVQSSKFKVEEELKKLEKKPLTERVKFLGQAYALGVKMYEKEKKVQEEIKDLNYFVYVASQELLKKDKGWQPIVNYKQYIKGQADKLKQIKQLYEAGLRWSLEYFEKIYQRLGTKFDGYYPESWTGELGMKLVEEGLKKGVLEESDGAIVYKGEKDGLHTRVFVNKLGLPTYEAKDLGLAQAKYQDFEYDLSINVFGKEIDEYYKVVAAALTRIRPKLGKRTIHLAHGMVNLPEGKMSSRTGNVITVEWLLSQTKKQALKIMTDSDLSVKEKQEVVEMISQAAVKYAFLKSSIGDNIIFDFGKSVSLEGNSGPYLLYTYARCKSVLRKAEKLSSIKEDREDKILNTKYLIPNTEEAMLLRTLYRFPEVVVEAAKNLSPNLICSFLFDLAQKYNLFYDKHRILNPEVSRQLGGGQMGSPEVEDLQLTNFRLALTTTTAAVIKRGLYLLGIKTVERM